MSGNAVIERQRRVFDDFFKIDELLVTHQQIDGTMSAVQKRLVFERGDSIAAVLLHVERKSVVLVEQFKVPTLVARRRDDPLTTDGWIVETVAGMIDADETPETAAIRETFEETGYRIQRPHLIAQLPTFFFGRSAETPDATSSSDAKLRSSVFSRDWLLKTPKCGSLKAA